MTVGAVTFDFGGAYAPAFPLPDASGLMPLSLPEEFLHRHGTSSSLPQPSSDAVLRFENAMGAEPLVSPIVEIKNLVAAGTVPIASKGTDPIHKGTDPIHKGTDPIHKGTDPIHKGTVPMHTVGTDPMPQTGIIVENSVEKSILTKNPVLLDNPVVEVKVVMPRGTDPVLVRGTDPVPKVSSPAQVVGTDPRQVVGTDPMPAMGTDHVTRLAVAKEGEVSGREVSIAPKVRVAPEVRVASEVRVAPEVPVATEVTVAPNKESYVAPVVASVKDIPVVPSLEVEVGEVVEKVAEPTSETVLPTETKLSQETTRPTTEATSLAHETLVQVPEAAKPTIEVTKPTLEVTKPTIEAAKSIAEAAKPIAEAAKPTLEAKPEIKLESAPVIDRAEPEDEVVALDVKKAQPLQAAPVAVAADPAGTVDAQSATAREVSAVSAATARTEAVVEVVDKLVEAVVSQIAVTPSIVRGEGEVRITLKANVLDGSSITLSSKGGELAVVVTPATPEAAQTVAVAAPRLEVALAEHVPTFRNVVVKLGSVSRKGNSDETA